LESEAKYNNKKNAIMEEIVKNIKKIVEIY
jgi:hypothetical protein